MQIPIASSQETNLRPAVPMDIQLLYRLVKDHPSTFPPQLGDLRPVMSYFVGSETGFLWVAERQRRIVGYLLGVLVPSFESNGTVGMIYELLVDTHHRSQGLGRQLTWKFEDWAKKKGARAIVLVARTPSEFPKVVGYQPTAGMFLKKV
ncbi:MAG: GNAT family N-acetyltransferase [Deltaproteobacteria bacterium]|nr:GNAT family N-acetyltransferase [Deltaproteobacteria bacterium]